MIGPSGCGKSTLLQMAAGLLMPTRGTVHHRGRAIETVNREVGFVPQQAQLFPWKTLAENVELPLLLRGVTATERRERVAAALDAVGLTGFEQYFPNQLSGGMQKRGSIARTLIYRPDVILMDEPFGALDAQTRMVMQDDLQILSHKAGATVLFVTHDITEAVLLADNVAIMSQRPSKLLANIAIDLPRPRNVFEPFKNPGFEDAYDAVWTCLPVADRYQAPTPLTGSERQPMNDLATTPDQSIAAEGSSARRSLPGKVGRGLMTLLPGLMILAFWQWASGRLIKEIYVSKPTAVAARLYELFASGEIFPHLWTTGQELVLGYVIGVAGGIFGGYMLGRSPRLASMFEPYVMAFYGIPKIALAPLFIIWFGIGIGSKVALAAIMVFFLVFYNVYTGVRSVDRELVNLTLVMGANERQLTYHVYFPAAAPYVLLGMRMAIPYSVIGVIVGEFTSSIQGLGLFIHEASSTYDPAGVFAGIVILLAFVATANFLAGRLERRLLRWKTLTATAPNDI